MVEKKTDHGEGVEQNINLLREKTFNPELKNLVLRISGNEDKGDRVDYSKDSSKLILDLHKLFYRIKYIDEISKLHLSFEPFALEDNSVKFDEMIFSQIEEKLSQFNLQHFTLLRYELEQKAYIPIINKLKISNENLIFSLNDKILKDISTRPEGMIIDESNFDEYPAFRSKTVSPNMEEVNDRYYIVYTESIILNLYKELNKGKVFNSLTSSLLIFQIYSDDNVSEELLKVLQDNFAIQFFILDDYVINDKFPIHYNHLNEIYPVIDYILRSSRNDVQLKGYVIELSDKASDESIMIFTYLYSKLERYLSQKSLIIRASFDRYVIVSSAENNIDGIIDDFNKHMSEKLEIKRFNLNDFNNLDIIRDIIKI